MRFPTRIVVAIAGLAALTASLLPGLAAAEVPPAEVPAELEAAIKQHIESEGHVFAGFCRDVIANEPSATPGEYCAFVISIEHEIAEVTYGAVFSDELSFVSFKFENGAWTQMGEPKPVNQQPQPQTQTPVPTSTPRAPSTGSGTAPSGETLPVLAILGGLTLAIGFGAIWAEASARRR